MEIKFTPFIIFPSNSLAKIFLSLPMMLSSACLEVLNPKGNNTSSRRHNNDSIELNVKTAVHPLRASHTSEQRRKHFYCAQ